jgi:hypothetical protein
MKIDDLLSPTGQALLRAYGCPVCGCRDAACESLEAATPEPDHWCHRLENALEQRGWWQWAQRNVDRKREALENFRRWQMTQALMSKTSDITD